MKDQTSGVALPQETVTPVRRSSPSPGSALWVKVTVLTVVPLGSFTVIEESLYPPAVVDVRVNVTVPPGKNIFDGYDVSWYSDWAVTMGKE